jgi:hypothetical protein
MLMVLNDGKFTTKQYSAYLHYLCYVTVRYCMYHCLLSAESRAVVITVAPLKMFVTYNAMHLQCCDTVIPWFTDVVLLQVCYAGPFTNTQILQ